MLHRNQSEERFYQYLLKADFDNAQIKEPDKDPKIRGTADFMVEDVVFEVKEILPDKSQREEIRGALEELRKRKGVFHFMPDVTKQYTSDIKSSNKKFKNYTGYATCHVADISEWSILEPDIESLLHGKQKLVINKTSLEVIDATYKNRLFRLDRYRNFGCLAFLNRYSCTFYHNLMSRDHKMLPIDFMYAFKNVPGTRHFIMFNIPKGGVRMLEKYGKRSNCAPLRLIELIH